MFQGQLLSSRLQSWAEDVQLRGSNPPSSKLAVAWDSCWGIDEPAGGKLLALLRCLASASLAGNIMQLFRNGRFLLLLVAVAQHYRVAVRLVLQDLTNCLAAVEIHVVWPGSPHVLVINLRGEDKLKGVFASFPELEVLSRSPYNEDYSMLESTLDSPPVFGNSHLTSRKARATIAKL